MSATNLAGRLVAAFDTTWRAIQARHADVPTVVVTVGSGTVGVRAGQERLGHFAAGRWQHGNDRLPELFVSGESLCRGAVDVLGTLLHEATHGVAHVRGVQDTSRQGRYHNRRFKRLGEELGLALADDPRIGWSLTTVPSPTIAAYRAELALLGDALVVYRHAETRATARHTTNLAVATCACPRRIRVALATLTAAPITCGACGHDFVHKGG